MNESLNAVTREHDGNGSNEDIHVPMVRLCRGLSKPEAKLLELFPINRMTAAMLDLLKKDVVAEFIRLQLITKMYGHLPDVKPDPETLLYQFLDFMLSKRFQVSKDNVLYDMLGR